MTRIVFGQQYQKNRKIQGNKFAPAVLTEEQFIENWGYRTSSTKMLHEMLMNNERHLNMLMSVSQKRDREEQ